MSRKLYGILLIVLVVLQVTISFADSSWTCPKCGRSGNTGNYCPICSTENPNRNSTWDCPKCYHRNKSEYRYCESCAEPKPIWARAIMKLAINNGPGTSKYFSEIGTYRVEGEMVRVFAKSWDTDNGIWWIQCEVPNQSHIIGWTGLKRFEIADEDFDALTVVVYDRVNRRYVN